MKITTITLHKRRQHMHHLAGMRHIHKNAENIQRQQRQDYSLYGFNDYILQVDKRIAQRCGFQMRESKPHGEGPSQAQS